MHSTPLPVEQPVSRQIVTRDQVLALERQIQRMPPVDCPVRHYFAPGMAAREMTVPAGVVLTGAVHRHEHLCTISKGRIAVSTDDGMKVLSAPYTFVSRAGSKRVGYAIEETVWTTYHATDETDIDRLIEEITESTAAELLGGARNAQMLAQIDRDDYRRFLAEYGLHQDVVTRLVENEADQIPMPEGVDTLHRAPSVIAGEGLFAACGLAEGDVVAPVRLGGKRTPAGRFINHSATPNLRFISDDEGDLFAIACRPIRAGDEVTVDYRQAMSVNGAGIKPIEVTE
ncbi:SET domain-containing protein-lysine N-methyltransferase [Burkholderia thailandensis]|uniref:SET domain-containing protein-lysine N-methyltransferase n=1 Tax=Burkholderia thailandensis TaxID=57975 RepID=UPI0005B721C6|nr:SET domain-containing protein-lysine N-methyltransferase [Burkholderia thailandensis]AVR10305.1 SET domain-containing protein-lysine N-methyltransferase [Burkholderia thailandensis]KIS57434.1 SET domain protein [Burkholderia thailandensis Phuket 4W-1]